MKILIAIFVIGLLAIVISERRESIVGAAVAPPPSMGFFVTSAKSKTGNLGGLAGADKICQSLAAAVGQGDKTWRAYLSAERDPANNNNPTNARDRIGNGPWFNANGLMVGNDLADLHARRGNSILLVDERGRLPGHPCPRQLGPGRADELLAAIGETLLAWEEVEPPEARRDQPGREHGRDPRCGREAGDRLPRGWTVHDRRDRRIASPDTVEVELLGDLARARRGR